MAASKVPDGLAFRQGWLSGSCYESDCRVKTRDKKSHSTKSTPEILGHVIAQASSRGRRSPRRLHSGCRRFVKQSWIASLKTERNLSRLSPYI